MFLSGKRHPPAMPGCQPVGNAGRACLVKSMVVLERAELAVGLNHVRRVGVTCLSPRASKRSQCRSPFTEPRELERQHTSSGLHIG